MASNVFGIGMSGMNAAQAGLVTTGHNISNASTPGYSRQEIVQTSNLPQFTGIGFLGQGVGVNTVKRLYSDALAGQLTLAQSQGSQLEAYYTQISQLSNLLGDPNAGLSPALQDFFSGVADLASHPESVPSRQTLLASASALVVRFQSFDQQFDEMRASLNSDITSSIGSINSYSQQIAALNQNILVTESATGNQQANDLRDQRDALVAELNQQVRASVVRESNGNYNIFIGNGQPVVVGSRAYSLVATKSLEDPQRVEVGYQSGATTIQLSSSGLQGGQLGGLLSFRSNTLDSVQNGLGRVAMGLAQSFNDQHALGQDLNGALGGQFFSVSAPAVLPSSKNVGTGVVTAALQSQHASDLTVSDYRLTFNGSAAGNDTYKLTRLSDGTITTAVVPSATGYPYTMTVDGVDLTLSPGAVGPTLNDTWLIEPTRAGASNVTLSIRDPASIAAAAPIRTAAALANKGNGAISAGSVSSVANLPLPATISLTYSTATGQFTVAGAVPAAGPFAYPATTVGVAPNVTGAAPAFSGNIAANAFSINGVNVGAVTVGGNAVAQGANLAAAINLVSASSGVTATASSTTGALTLTAPGGRQIAIAGTLTDTGLTAAITPGNTISFNGITFTMSGTPANGDVFTVGRNTGGASDNRNALTLGALQLNNTLGRNAAVAGSQATITFQSAYSQLVSQVGNTTRQLEVTTKAQTNMIAETRQAQQSVSGVNLDEEAANLLRYQQAYQASGKMMQIASSLFQTVLELGR